MVCMARTRGQMLSSDEEENNIATHIRFSLACQTFEGGRKHLVTSLSFYNFPSSFLKHGHGRQRKVLSWGTSSPAEVWHTSSCNSGTKL